MSAEKPISTITTGIEQATSGGEQVFNGIISKALDDIKNVSGSIDVRFGHMDAQAKAGLVDEALVYVAHEAIAEAESDDTDAESSGNTDVANDAISAVVARGMDELLNGTPDDDGLIVGKINEAKIAQPVLDVIAKLKSMLGSEAEDNGALEAIDMLEKALLADAAEKTGGREEIVEESAPLQEAKERRQEDCKRLADIITEVRSAGELAGEDLSRIRRELVCDGTSIEGQRISVGIEDIEDGNTGEKRRAVVLLAKMVGAEQGAGVFKDASALMGSDFSFVGQKKVGAYRRNISAASVLMSAYEKDGVKVYVAGQKPEDDSGVIVRSAIGLVRIEIPEGMEPEAASEAVAEVFEDGFDVPGALGEVPDGDSEAYKTARYEWHHMLGRHDTKGVNGDVAQEEISESAHKLVRREVFPGYSTMVDEGKHEEYLGDNPDRIRPMHHLNSGGVRPDSIARILRTGLMSTTERFSRGVVTTGMSSWTDLRTGGADSVFLRLKRWSEGEAGYVVFKPEILDRTDWYAYNMDAYGATGEHNGRSFAKNRMSPEEMLEAAKAGQLSCCNELMFRTGVPPEMIETIVCGGISQKETRKSVIKELHAEGIFEVGGRLLEEILLTESEYVLPPEELSKLLAKRRVARKILDGEEMVAFASVADYAEGDVELQREMIRSLAKHDSDGKFLESILKPLGAIVDSDDGDEDPNLELIKYGLEACGVGYLDAVMKANEKLAEEAKETIKMLESEDCDCDEYADRIIGSGGAEETARFFVMTKYVIGYSEKAKTKLREACMKKLSRDFGKARLLEWVAEQEDGPENAADKIVIQDLGIGVDELTEAMSVAREYTVKDVKEKLRKDDVDAASEIKRLGIGFEDYDDSWDIISEVIDGDDAVRSKVWEVFKRGLLNEGRVGDIVATAYDPMYKEVFEKINDIFGGSLDEIVEDAMAEQSKPLVEALEKGGNITAEIVALFGSSVMDGIVIVGALAEKNPAYKEALRIPLRSALAYRAVEDGEPNYVDDLGTEFGYDADSMIVKDYVLDTFGIDWSDLKDDVHSEQFYRGIMEANDDDDTDNVLEDFDAWSPTGIKTMKLAIEYNSGFKYTLADVWRKKLAKYPDHVRDMKRALDNDEEYFATKPPSSKSSLEQQASFMTNELGIDLDELLNGY